jgi:hypothetical protein
MLTYHKSISTMGSPLKYGPMDDKSEQRCGLRQVLPNWSEGAREKRIRTITLGRLVAHFDTVQDKLTLGVSRLVRAEKEVHV